ncbi:hypothetical protein L9F63_001083, partial [Diploptera punctata]
AKYLTCLRPTGTYVTSITISEIINKTIVINSHTFQFSNSVYVPQHFFEILSCFRLKRLEDALRTDSIHLWDIRVFRGPETTVMTIHSSTVDEDRCTRLSCSAELSIQTIARLRRLLTSMVDLYVSHRVQIR